MSLKNLQFSSSDQAGNFKPDQPYGGYTGAVATSRWATEAEKSTDIQGIKNYNTYAIVSTSFQSEGMITVTNEFNNDAYAAESYSEQYGTLISQYDDIIKDTSYKGVNLLKGDIMEVKFNETGEDKLVVQGTDISSSMVGLNTTAWVTLDDVVTSLNELKSAISTLRSVARDLGNNHSIIQTRQDFTENLINVLEEGADKLVLADMNEQSANMLSLQTRQQLAINALSLATQAEQGVLRLF